MRNPVLLRLGRQVARGSETWGNRDFLFALHALSALELVPRSGHAPISSRMLASASTLKVGEIAVVLEVCAQSQIFDQQLLDALCEAAVRNFNEFTLNDPLTPSGQRQSNSTSSSDTTTLSLQLNSPVEEYCRQLARMANALNTLRYCHLAFYSTVAIWLGYGLGHQFLDKGNAKSIRRYVDEVRSQLNQIALMSNPTLTVAALTTAIDGIHHKCNAVPDIDESFSLGDSQGTPSHGREVFLKIQAELAEVLSQCGWPTQATYSLLQRLPASVLSLDQLTMLKLLRCLRRCTNLAVREGESSPCGHFPQEASLRRLFQLLSETFCLSLKEGVVAGNQPPPEGRLAAHGMLEGKVVARMLATIRPYQTIPSSPPEPSWFFTLRSGILGFLAEKLSAKSTSSSDAGGTGSGDGPNLMSVTWSDLLQALQCLRNSALGQASVQNVLLTMLRGVAAARKETPNFFDLNSYLRVGHLLSGFHLSPTARLAIVEILLSVWSSEELSTTLGGPSLLDAATALFCAGLSLVRNVESSSELNEAQRHLTSELNGKLFHILDLALRTNEASFPSSHLPLGRADELISTVAELLQTPGFTEAAPAPTRSRLLSFMLQQLQAQFKEAAPLSFLANALWLLGRLAGADSDRQAVDFPTLHSPDVKEMIQACIRRLLELLRSIVKIKVVERLKVNKEKARSPAVSDEIKSFLKVLDAAVLLPVAFRRQETLPGFGSLTEAVAICVALRWPLLSSNEYCQAANLLIQLDIFDVYLIEELQRKTEAWAELHQAALPLDIAGGWNLLSAWERLQGITPAQYRCLQLISDALTISGKEKKKAEGAEAPETQHATNPTTNVALAVLKPTAMHLEGKLRQLKEKVIQN